MVRAKQASDAIMKTLSVANKEDAVKSLNEMKRQADVIKNIQELIPSQNVAEWPKYIKTLKEENDRLRAEQKRISQLLASDSSVDISKTIQEIKKL